MIAARFALDREPEDAPPGRFTRARRGLFITARQDDVAGYRDAWACSGHYPASDVRRPRRRQATTCTWNSQS